MRLHPLLYGAARSDTARRPQREPVPFQMLLPLELKNSVSGKSDKTKEAACIQELAVLFSCFKNKDFDQAQCLKEINAFQNCYKGYREKSATLREQERKGILVPGEKKLTHRQVNQLLRRFPNVKQKESKA